MGFCFIFWLLSIKDEGSLGILNQKILCAVTLFWVQITQNEKRTGCPPVLKSKCTCFLCCPIKNKKKNGSRSKSSKAAEEEEVAVATAVVTKVS